MSTLITGGAGYIGGSVASACIDAGLVPIILDDLSTGSADSTAGRIFYRGDIADGPLLDHIFRRHPDIDSVIHCAGRISVPESMDHPLSYFRTNVGKTVELLECLVRNGCHRVIFSSSAAVYAPSQDLTVDENSPVAPSSPYAKSKLMVETILGSMAATGHLRAISLRYFNPVGVDPLLRTGPRGQWSENAMGKLVEAWCTGREFTVTGTGWPTRDGSAIRDYVHVWDLAQAHIQALARFDQIVGGGGRTGENNHQIIDLGSGCGTTVRELVAQFQQVAGGPWRIGDASSRPGDGAGAYSVSDKAAALLNWSARLSVGDAIRDSLAWQRHRVGIRASERGTALFAPHQ